jgi:hypothetical protein
MYFDWKGDPYEIVAILYSSRLRFSPAKWVSGQNLYVVAILYSSRLRFSREALRERQGSRPLSLSQSFIHQGLGSHPFEKNDLTIEEWTDRRNPLFIKA